ncbi:MAG: class II glutamine amidotransferase [Bacteriovoracaceae bacterium]|nr:class II glutamine amidotransferase [Bacteriovoracaceae bacterium]
MCRLFGFRSVINSQVHSSLLHAENALHSQSKRHPDGWGIAYYLERVPHLVKSSDTALDDHLFKRVSGVVSSHTVMAHIRKATQGEHTILNSHPFQYGNWIFAHNGNINNLERHRAELLELITPSLRKFILGNTDSEIIFYILLSEIEKTYALNKLDVPVEQLKIVIQNALRKITFIIGPLINRDKPQPNENYISFLLTNGQTFIGFQGGQPLKYCTHKTKCPERDECPYFSKVCEAPSSVGTKINHLILTSEKIEGVNVWNTLMPGEMVGVDHTMNFFKEKLKVPFED